MFRLTCFVEDRDLANVMHALAGRAKGLEVVPVAGSNPELAASNGLGRGGVPGPRTPQLKRADIVAAGGAPQMLVAIMRRQKITEVNAFKTKELCRQMGLSETSYSHLLQIAMKAGLLRKAGKDPDGLGFLWKLTDKAGDK